MSEQRILGIVGGIGPESTADYYRGLVARWRERGPADTYPSVIIDSLNSRAALGAMLGGDIQPTVQLFGASVDRLAGAGVGLALIASVMMHMAFEPVAAAAPIPMLSILDAMVAEAKRRAIRRPGVLGTRPTTEGSFFARPFEEAGIELVRPDEQDRAWIHQIYFDELVGGTFHDETRARLIAIVENMRQRSAIDGVILGGTELPLILREPSYAGVPVLDSIGIHVDAALDWLLDTGQPPSDYHRHMTDQPPADRDTTTIPPPDEEQPVHERSDKGSDYNDPVDDASDDSFPASDPPSFTDSSATKRTPDR